MGSRRGGGREFVFIPAGEGQKVEEEEIAENEEEGLIHQSGCVGQSLTVRGLLLFGGNQKALLEGAHVKDFDDGHAGDAEKVGGVGGEQAGLNETDDLED